MIINVSATETRLYPSGSMWWYEDPPEQASPGDLSYDNTTQLWHVFNGAKWVELRP